MKPLYSWSLLLSVLLLVFVFVIIRLFMKFVNGDGGKRRAERTIAIGIASVFFTGTINQAIVYPVLRLLRNLQLYLSYGFPTLDFLGPTKKEAPYFNPDDFTLTGAFENYPLAWLVIYFAFILLIYKLIELARLRWAVVPVPVAGPSQTGNLVDDFPTIYNCIILFVLGFSMFLVVSVFITIPYLEQIRKPSVFTQARLDTTMQNRSKLDGDILKIDIDNSPFPRSSILKTIIDADSSNYSKLEPINRNLFEQTVKSLQDANDYGQNQRQYMVDALKNDSAQYKRKESSLRQRLSSNFETATQSLNSDKAAVYQLLFNQYVAFVGSQRDNFTGTLSQLKKSDNNNRQLFAEYSSRLSVWLNQLIEKQGQKALGITDTSLLKASGNIPGYFYFSPYYTYPPGPEFEENVTLNIEKNGTEWGFFGSMAKYLIQTESSDLVLLIGMFGFGLLGASILSFRKDNDFFRTFNTQPIIENFGNVLARGFGAALIVYMSIKGGLTIFTGGATPDPNGYLLLLTCFIGAVYSEQIWDRMKGSSMLTGKGGGQTPGSTPAPGGGGAPAPVPGGGSPAPVRGGTPVPVGGSPAPVVVTPLTTPDVGEAGEPINDVSSVGTGTGDVTSETTTIEEQNQDNGNADADQLREPLR